METPRHPAGPAFEKAANAIEAWRQQQIAALTDTQRRLYEDALRRAEEREKAKTKELEKRKLPDIQERIRRKLWESRALELHPHGARRTKITEAVARRALAELAQPGTRTEPSFLGMLARQAAEAAAAEIEREHKREIEVFQEREREKLDRLLGRFERARETQLENRQDFARAASAGRAKTNFQKAAKGDGIPVDPVKSEAIARAITKVKAKEEEERSRGERDQGRGRSLTDTFNRAR